MQQDCLDAPNCERKPWLPFWTMRQPDCTEPWPTSLKRTATCASTRGKRECGTRQAKCLGILVSLGCRTCSAGLELGKGLLFLGPLLVLMHLSGLSFWRREPATTSSCSACPSSMTCKHLGCCCFFVALRAATTFSGCFPRRSRPSTPQLFFRGLSWC